MAAQGSQPQLCIHARAFRSIQQPITCPALHVVMRERTSDASCLNMHPAATSKVDQPMIVMAYGANLADTEETTADVDLLT